MTTENLGIVFAPNLLRAPNATEMNVMDLQVRMGREKLARSIERSDAMHTHGAIRLGVF